MQTTATDVEINALLCALYIDRFPVGTMDTSDICGGPATGMSSDPQLVARFSHRIIDVQPAFIEYDAHHTNYNDIPPLEDEPAQDPDPRDDFKDEVAMLAPEEPSPRARTPPEPASVADSLDLHTIIEQAYNTLRAMCNNEMK